MTKHVTGPIQVFVIGFEDPDFSGKILKELKKVRKRGVIRLIDLLFVQKAADGTVTSTMHQTDLSEEERQRLGGLAGGLIGLGAAGLPGVAAGIEAGERRVAERDYGMDATQLADLADSIPNGSAGIVMVVEHHWAARLSEAIRETGGDLLVQAMIGSDLLLTVGAELEARIEAEAAIEEAEAIKYAAAMEVMQVLAEAELIEEAAMAEAADVVATALAIEDAAAADVAEALIDAEFIEAVAADEVAAAVEEALAIEDAAAEDAADAIEVAQDIKAAAAIEALRAIRAANVIEADAAQAAVDALVAAEIIEEEAAADAVAAVLASEEIAEGD